MKMTKHNLITNSSYPVLLSTFLFATMLLLHSCGNDPEPEEEEEVITTMRITLTPQAGGDDVIMEFYDEDGNGPKTPEYSVSGPLMTNAVYNGAIQLFNETENPVEEVTEEIEDEKDDHIFCYTVTGLNLTIDNFDKDNENRNVGLTSRWSTTNSSEGSVRVVLRHQPGTKTGDCPGTGATDIDVTFTLEID